MSATRNVSQLQNHLRQVNTWLTDADAELVIEPRLSGYPWREIEHASKNTSSVTYLYTRNRDIVSAALKQGLTKSREPSQDTAEAPYFKIKLTPELSTQFASVTRPSNKAFDAGRLFELSAMPSGTSIFHAAVSRNGKRETMLIFHRERGGIDPILTSLREKNGLLGSLHDPSLHIERMPDGSFTISLQVPERLARAIEATAGNAVMPLAEHMKRAPASWRKALEEGTLSPKKLQEGLRYGFSAPRIEKARPPEPAVTPSTPDDPKPASRTLASDSDWLRAALVFTHLRQADGSLRRAVALDRDRLPSDHRNFMLLHLTSAEQYSRDAVSKEQIHTIHTNLVTLEESAFQQLTSHLGGDASIRQETQVRPFQLFSNVIGKVKKRGEVRVGPEGKTLEPRIALRAGHSLDAMGKPQPVLYIKGANKDVLTWSGLPWPHAALITGADEVPAIWRTALTEDVLRDLTTQCNKLTQFDFKNDAGHLSDNGMRLVFQVKTVTAPEETGAINKLKPEKKRIKDKKKKGEVSALPSKQDIAPESNEIREQKAVATLQGFVSPRSGEATRLIVAQWRPPLGDPCGQAPRMLLALRGTKGELRRADDDLRIAGMIDMTKSLPNVPVEQGLMRAFWLNNRGAALLATHVESGRGLETNDKSILANRIQQAFREADREAQEAKNDPVKAALQHLRGRELRKVTVRHPRPNALDRPGLGAEALEAHLATVAIAASGARSIADIARHSGYRWSRILGHSSLQDAALLAGQLSRHADSTEGALTAWIRQVKSYQEWVTGLNGRDPVQLIVANPTQQTIEALSAFSWERPYDTLVGRRIGGKNALILYPSLEQLAAFEEALGKTIQPLIKENKPIPSICLEEMVTKNFAPITTDKFAPSIQHDTPEKAVAPALMHFVGMRSMLALIEPEDPSPRLPSGSKVEERLSAQPVLCFQIRQKGDVTRLAQIRGAFEEWLAEPKRYGPVEQVPTVLLNETQHLLNACEDIEKRRGLVIEYGRQLGILNDPKSREDSRDFSLSWLIQMNKEADTLGLEGSQSEREVELKNSHMWPKLLDTCEHRLKDLNEEMSLFRNQLSGLNITTEDRQQVERYRDGETVPRLSVIRESKGFCDDKGQSLSSDAMTGGADLYPRTVFLPITKELADAINADQRTGKRNRLINNQLKERDRLPSAKIEELAALYQGQLRSLRGRS